MINKCDEIGKLITLKLHHHVSIKFYPLIDNIDNTLRALVSYTFVFVYMQEFGYCILFRPFPNKGNQCETTNLQFAAPCNINSFNGIENGGG